MKALTSKAESASRDPPAAEKIKKKDEENPVLAKVPGLIPGLLTRTSWTKNIRNAFLFFRARVRSRYFEPVPVQIYVLSNCNTVSLKTTVPKTPWIH